MDDQGGKHRVLSCHTQDGCVVSWHTSGWHKPGQQLCSCSVQACWWGISTTVSCMCRREVSADKAFLRLDLYDKQASTANEGNSAAHLLVYALHNIIERTARNNDPRMRSLKSVAHLKSLQKGDISNYKWGGRQPVRRLAGDVHGDMTCIVLELTNSGALACRHPFEKWLVGS